ncbi:ABC transporter substrate-binding protein [Kitasatospora indigofera]|uniref:ABC transporter substrate-binding protein n=2 Tax=Kitasatospora indigofera TaxID=67307 RepID=A0A919D8C7_9ACTN|nr:ABC transporter substrate-binding protein [Kitasatospora indigofera]
MSAPGPVPAAAPVPSPGASAPPAVRARRAARARRRLAGVAFLMTPVLLAWLAVAVYDRRFTDSATVTVEAGSVGHEMHVNADVKLRGVVVGRVREIRTDGDGARLTLDIDPARLRQIPGEVSAQLLPTTLFGERFVALVPAAHPSGRSLVAGSTVPRDRSDNAVELQQVLDHLMPLLTAVRPEKLAATLNAVATALDGRGTRLGVTLTQLDGYLGRLNPELPVLVEDVQRLVEVSRVYDRAAPEIVQALTDFTRTSETVAQQRTGLATLYGTTAGAAQDLDTFLRQNKDNLIRLSTDSRDTLGLLARYAPSFPCTLSTLAGFVPAMDKALGKGTDQPGLHITVTTVPSRGKYLPGQDAPGYRAGGGPACYAVPYTGIPVTPADPATTPVTAGPAGAAGLPNSPQENALVTELLAPGMNATPQDLPDWTSLLAGPVLRGAEVTLR